MSEFRSRVRRGDGVKVHVNLGRGSIQVPGSLGSIQIPGYLGSIQVADDLSLPPSLWVAAAGVRRT